MAKARMYHLPFFTPVYPGNAEILFTTEEVYAYLRSLKLRVEDDHVDYLVKRGIVGFRKITGQGKKKSVKGRWSLPQRELLREALTLEQRGKMSGVELCILPVSKWLYWGDPADIELEQIKRAMQTWATYQQKRPRRSYEHVEREVRQFLRTIGHPDAVDKPAIGGQLANWFYNGRWPEEKVLQEYLKPVIDPDYRGECRGPQGASFSVEAVSYQILARQKAIEQMAKRQIPDPIWQWARAFYLVFLSTYEQKRPTMLAEVANDQAIASLFQASTLDQLYTQACHQLAQVVGVGLLDPAPPTLPEQWQLATWLRKGTVGRVSSQPVPTGLYGPSGQPLMHLSISVSCENPSGESEISVDERLTSAGDHLK